MIKITYFVHGTTTEEKRGQVPFFSRGRPKKGPDPFSSSKTLKEARRRESEIKDWRREKKLSLISEIV